MDNRRKTSTARVPRRSRRQVADAMSFANRNPCRNPPRRGSGRVRKRAARHVAASVKPARRAKKTSIASATISTQDAERVAKQLDAIEHDGGSGTLDLETGPLEVSNLGKIFFPATKQTKGDLMRFYARMSPYLLPAIADRPLVLKRFPNGIEGKAFYQQKAPQNPPRGVRVAPVSDEGLTTADRLIGGNLATLLYIIQLGAISVDPWHSRVQSVQFADYSIIDLDPGPRAQFARVVEVARAVKEVLDGFKLQWTRRRRPARVASISSCRSGRTFRTTEHG